MVRDVTEQVQGVSTEGGRVQGIYERIDCQLLSKISQNTQESPFKNWNAPTQLGTVKFVASVNSFVLTAGEASRSRSLPSKGAPGNGDDRVI